MENRRYLLKLFALFLLLSYLLPLSAVPLSRNLALKNQNLPAEEIANQAIIPIKEETNLGEKMARMDIEINDYPGSGANPRHDPRSPGRA